MSIRTFNSAKRYSEEVLHPLISSHTNAKLTSRLGAPSIEEANKMPPGVRVWNRFNALKTRIAILQTLLTEITATILLNGDKGEAELVESLQTCLSNMETDVDERSGELVEEGDRKLSRPPKLTNLFKSSSSHLDKIYISTQRLMTTNKLLFYSEDDEFLEDSELRGKIKTISESA